MDIRGPCFYKIRNGQPFNKYEILASKRTPKGTYTTKYWFDKEEDAELYLMYLFQCQGERELDALMHSDRTYKWEKRELQEFIDSIDWEELPNRIANMKFETETTSVEMRVRL